MENRPEVGPDAEAAVGAKWRLIDKLQEQLSKLETHTIKETITQPGDVLSHLEANKENFDKVGNTYFDKGINPTVKKIVFHFVNIVGLGKDDIYITFGDRNTLKHEGNTSIIMLNPELLPTPKMDGVSFGNLVGKKLTNAIETYKSRRCTNLS